MPYENLTGYDNWKATEPINWDEADQQLDNEPDEADDCGACGVED